MKITFGELRRLNPRKKKSLTELEMEYCKTTQGVDISMLFYGAENLTKLDMSAFDFSGVTNMRDIFADCKNLRDVILSDTLLNAKCPVKKALNKNKLPNGAFIDEHGNPCYYGYGNAGPYSAYEDRIPVPDFQLVYEPVSFDKTTQADWRKYFGLTGLARITIVPHKVEP